jgi:fibronectin-binding autotransporter adhesin
MRVFWIVCRALGCSAIALGTAYAVSFPRPVLADSLDWRNASGQSFVTPIKNQHLPYPVGTCWAFSATAALETKYMLTRNDSTFVPDLSEQNLVCPGTMGGTGGGSPTAALNYLTSTGIVSETELPYTAEGTSPNWPLQSGWQSRVVKSVSNDNSISCDTSYLKTMMRTYGALVTVISTDDFYTGPGTGLPSGSTNHAVALVGFVDDLNYPGGGYWIVKNSWGTGWCQSGYGTLTYAVTEYRNQTHVIDGPAYYAGSMGTATWGGGAGTWTAGGSANWSIAGSITAAWQNQETLAVFNAAGSTVTLSGTVIAHGLNVAGAGYRFNGGSLTVTGDGISTTQDVTFSAPVTVGAPQTWTIAAGKAMTVSGAVHTVVSDLTLANSGTLSLTGGIDGGGVINAQGAAPGSILHAGSGTLYITGATNSTTNLVVSAGTVSFSGGTFQLGGYAVVGGTAAARFTQSSGSVWVASALTLGSSSTGNGAYDLCGGTLAVPAINKGSGSAALSIGGATLRATAAFSCTLPMTLTGTGGNATVDTQDYAVALSGSLSGAGGLTKTGAGTLTLSTTNAYIGTTTVSAGVLRITGSIAASSGISVAGGSLLLAGGTASSVAVAGGASLVGSGAAGSVTVNAGGILGSSTDGGTWGGQLTVAALNFAGSSYLNVGNIGSYASNAAVRATQSGGLACGGPITVNVCGTAPAGSGTATLLQYSGAVSGSLSYVLGTASFVANSRSSCTLFISAGGSLGYLNAAYTFDYPYWTALAGDSGIWSTGTASGNRNWKLASNSAQTDYIEGDVVLFDDRVSTTSATVTLGQNLSPAGVTFNNSGSVAYTVTGGTAGYGIGGAGTLTKNGAGTVIILNPNTYTGLTTINGGVLQIGNGGAAGAVGGNVLNNGVLAFNRSGAYTFSYAVSGAGSVTHLSSGTLILTGNNTYTGLTTVSAGTLQIGNGGSSGAVAGNIVNNGTLVFNRSNAWTYGGAISGPGSVWQLGSGTVTLSHSSSYTGLTTVSTGVLAYGADGAIGSGAVTVNGGTLSLGPYDDTVGAVTLTSGAVTGPGALTSTSGFTVTGGSISAALRGSVALAKSGAGTVTLSGANTYSGGAILSAGCLVYCNTAAFGSGTLTLSGGTLVEGANNLVVSNRIFVDSGKNTYLAVTSSALPDARFSGSLTGSGSLTVSTAANYVWLQGNNSAFSGTFINQSIGKALIFLGSSSAGVSGSGNAAWVLNASARAYNVVGTIAFGALSGTNGSCYLGTQGSGNTVTYAIGALNTSTLFAGTICDGWAANTSGALVSVVKLGTGTLTLTGNNIYTGGTTIAAGALQIGAGSTAGSIAGNVLDNGTLAFNRSNAYTFSGLVSGSGALGQLGTGTLTLSQTNTYTGPTTVAAGVLAYGAARATGTGNLTVSGGTLNLGSYSGTSSAATLTSGVIAGSGTLTSTAGFNVSSGSVTAALAGPVDLVKSTTGTVTLAGANVYSGATYLNGGALVIRGAATTAILGTASTADISAGSLVFDYAAAGTATGESISSQVNAILAASYNGGTDSWASGVIHSTLANIHSTDSYSLGWNNDGTASAVTVKIVLYGDATMDGAVNIYDLGQVLANYNQSGTWATGDFNYDGTVNIYDLGKVLANYNQSLELTGTEVSTSEYPTLDGEGVGALEAAGVNVVPEPGTLALLTTGAIGLLAYAWRRRQTP